VQKHKLLEADIQTHDGRVNDLNSRADAFIDSGMWDTENIKEKKQSINERYERFVFQFCIVDFIVCFCFVCDNLVV